MDFGLSAEQRLLVATVRRFIVNELRPLLDAAAGSTLAAEYFSA